MRALYTGSFDPIIKGHYDIIKRISKIYTEVIVVVAINHDKKHMFNIKDRYNMVKTSLKKFTNVKVIKHDGIISDLINKHNINILVRGLRNSTDLDYEISIEQFTRQTTNDETIYLTPYSSNIHMSSTLVRNLLKTKKVKNIKKFVNKEVYKYLKKYQKNI
ncbi:MAG: pantetheine-phosphate adenylyltransferase [Bacteroidota bacterium]|nr:pantetheine-phosphate adenylyltransferase [Bacteroidota bacterium]